MTEVFEFYGCNRFLFSFFSSFQKQLSSGDLPDEPPIMTSDEILLCYWKISVSKDVHAKNVKILKVGTYKIIAVIVLKMQQFGFMVQ